MPPQTKEQLAKVGIDEAALIKRTREIEKLNDALARKGLKERYEKVKAEGD